MPPKRKEESQPSNTRVTRSSSRAQVVQPAAPVAKPARAARTRRTAVVPAKEDEEVESADELNIVSVDAGPSKPVRAATKPKTSIKSKKTGVVAVAKPDPPKRTRKRVVDDVVEAEGKVVEKVVENPKKKRKLAFVEPEPAPTVQKRSHVSPAPIHNKKKASDLATALNSQKMTIIRKLVGSGVSFGVEPSGTVEVEDEDSANKLAMEQLAELLNGTVNRGEGNSCMLLGPRGSGKSQIVDKCIADLGEKPIIIRLCGWIQYNDRLAIREIAYQLNQQAATQFQFDMEETEEDEEDPFADRTNEEAGTDFSVPAAHIHTLISCIPTLSRPTVIVLDGFDLFTFHARQSLLYSLLDTVQSCRGGTENKGMAVIGVTTRMDTLNLFEKRVKSRFSGRMIRTANPKAVGDWLRVAREMLFPLEDELETNSDFQGKWQRRTDEFLSHQKTKQLFEETFVLVRDVRTLNKLLTSSVLCLTPAQPWLVPALLEKAVETQRIRRPFPQLPNMSYPSLCLLVASMKADNLGYPHLTFEMLHKIVSDEIRGSASAPVVLNGMSIGMHRVPRGILDRTFEFMIAAKIFVPGAPVPTSIAQEFVKYRCTIERADVDKAVTTNGQLGLKSWWKKVKGN